MKTPEFLTYLLMFEALLFDVQYNFTVLIVALY